MARLKLSNNGRTVKIKIDNITLQYMGPKNLIRFNKINKISSGCLYVDTIFLDEDAQYVEEDFIDIKDLLMEYGYNADIILNEITEYEIEEGDDKMDKWALIDKALMVSDNFALIVQIGSAQDVQLLVVNMKKMNSRAIIRLKDYQVLSSNMSDTMLKRAKAAVERNSQMIKENMREERIHA